MKREHQRLADALDAPNYEVAVPALARALRAEGMSQEAMYRLFAEQQQRLSANEPRYDTVVDMMDLIWGGSWAKGRAIFDTEMKDTDIVRG